MGLSFLLALALRLPVHAGDPAPSDVITLVWEAPEGCPGESEVRERVVHYLGTEGIEHPRGDSRAHAVIRADEQGFALHMVLESATSLDETDVRAPTCGVLADIFALKLALTLDPRGVVEELDAAEAEPDELEALEGEREELEALELEALEGEREELEALEAEPEPELGPAAPLESRRSSVLPGVGAAVLVGRGVLPTADLGAAVAGSLALGLFETRLELQVLASPPRTLDLETGDGQLRTLALGGVVEACVAPSAGRFRFPSCIGFRGLAVRGRSQDISQEASAWRPYLALSAGPGLVWPNDAPLALLVRMQASVPVLRPRFEVGGVGEVYRSDPVAGQVLIGLEFRPGR